MHRKVLVLHFLQMIYVIIVEYIHVIERVTIKIIIYIVFVSDFQLYAHKTKKVATTFIAALSTAVRVSTEVCYKIVLTKRPRIRKRKIIVISIISYRRSLIPFVLVQPLFRR